MTNTNTDDIREGLEDILRAIITEWRQHPKVFALKDMLSVVQYGGMFLTRRGKMESDDERGGAGSAVRKYSGAFKTTHAGARGAAAARSAGLYPVPASDDDEAG